MRNEVMFAGFGGQGVIKAALLLAISAGLYEDKEVAQTQSYGPEARGGACRSEVVISDGVDWLKDGFLNISKEFRQLQTGRVQEYALISALIAVALIAVGLLINYGWLGQFFN